MRRLVGEFDMIVGMESFEIRISESDETPEAKRIHEALRREVESQVGPSHRQGLTLSVNSRTGELAGGLRGFSHWKWLYISHLWVTEAYRSKGLGAKLVAEAETVARHRGCRGLYVDTFDLKAARFYERQGFKEIGRIEDFPENAQRIFLAKEL
jgi:ribosomal protein S18 acetylase RimI-like enzyme